MCGMGRGKKEAHISGSAASILILSFQICLPSALLNLAEHSSMRRKITLWKWENKTSAVTLRKSFR